MRLLLAPLSSLLLMSLFHCLTVTALSPKSQGAITVVESPEGAETTAHYQDDEEEKEAEGDLEVVQPTELWQTLKPDQAVPAGSHVRLNLQTGHREVRLGEQQLKWTQRGEEEGTQPSFDPEELKRAMKKIKEDMKAAEHQAAVAAQYRPLEELKKDMAQLDLLVETDVQVMKYLLDQFNSTSSTTAQRLRVLQELEYLVHQVDNAQTLCSMGGLSFIFQGLNSSDLRLQESSAHVLGSALSSNPAVQVKAAEDGALHRLLTALVTATSVQVKKKVLFALASLLRHFPHAQQQFLARGGLQVLSELFKEDTVGALRSRVVTMLYDLISEKELSSQAGMDPALDATHQERLRQYSKVTLQEELEDEGWCLLVPQLLQSPEHDHREKALKALLAMAAVCGDQNRSDTTLHSSLHSLKELYQNLVQEEDSSYFEEMVELIDALQMKLRKSEIHSETLHSSDG
ncbi:nucleotide exchange factor SIL1 [Gouania willdenowi]|uniref:Nucleotide exchange factor SIL1 n=1 Tax=Gouania willdenowi TaxID=441366 RepID=A0A8C5GQA8_GOUWI|nr:nucleotide exchange factor SIL1 [Gouania willdenowi]